MKENRIITVHEKAMKYAQKTLASGTQLLFHVESWYQNYYFYNKNDLI